MADQFDKTTSRDLFGTISISGVGTYSAILKQASTRVTWVLLNNPSDVFEVQRKWKQSDIEAVLRVNNTGKLQGYGKTHLLTRLVDVFSTAVGLAAQNKSIDAGFFVRGEYQRDDAFIQFETWMSGRAYRSIRMSYEGFDISMEHYSGSISSLVSIPKNLQPVMDEKSQVVAVAGLGVHTLAILKRRMGSALDWYNSKRYFLVDSDEKFRDMMKAFLRDVQDAADRGVSVLTAIDTETTGLHMYNLAPSNPFRDHIVAIPFGWKNDEAYLICTDMHYFGNVSEDAVYPIFDKLFSRNADFTPQEIEIDFEGEHFKFSRNNITTVGANVGFDECAFMSHGVRLYFDEDIQIMHYNLATDWVQGRNGLKDMTHNYLHIATLELEDLFGPQHKDKFRYLSDPELALIYGGADADFPRVLWRLLRNLLPDNLYAMYKKYDMTIRYETALATWRGMEVDERGVKEAGQKVQEDLEALKEFIYKYAYAANRNSIEEKAEKLCSLLGVDSVADLERVGNDEGTYRYPFTPAGHKNLLFNVLGYPVLKTSAKSQEPALDKFVLKKLASRKRDTPVEFLLEDIPSASSPSEPLIPKKDFNECMYPLALVFQKYATLNKEYTAYYKPIIENDLEGRMFYNFSLQRAATRRILSPGQTMKGDLKRLVVAPPGQLYGCFDASQIEYRHMASLAYIQTKFLMQREFPNDWEQRLADSGIARIFNMMQTPEADYHIETASMMTGLPQHQINKKTRKTYKSIGFGIPYGLGDPSMCESLFGKITPELLRETRQVLADYKARQFEIIRLLETTRDSAFIPAKIPDGLREIMGIGDTYVGIVRNFTGFYRMFILENLTRGRTGRIRRQSGNCLIQGGAAELFRRICYNFHGGCVKEGIADDIFWKMLVHDEIDYTFNQSVDICKLIKLIHQNCTLRYTDHIPYYVGIGFGNSWYTAKDDAAELPVIMVDRLVKAYDSGNFFIPSDGQQTERLLKLKHHYMCDRVYEELVKIIPELKPGFNWTDSAVSLVDSNFSNYVVRAYLSAFLPKNEDRADLLVMLQSWQKAREAYGFNKGFEATRFEDARKAITMLDLEREAFGSISEPFEVDISDMSDTLSIDILSDADDNLAGAEILGENSDWFGESSLFDYSVTDDFVVQDTAEGHRYFNVEENDDDAFVFNENATNPFDLYVSRQYVRKHIFNSGENTYSVMLNGTDFYSDSSVLSAAIRKKFGHGTDTMVLIGKTIRKIESLNLTSEGLDNLDQILIKKGG